MTIRVQVNGSWQEVNAVKRYDAANGQWVDIPVKRRDEPNNQWVELFSALNLVWKTSGDWDSLQTETSVVHADVGQYQSDRVGVGIPVASQDGATVVGYWFLDEASGASTASDDSGNNNDGTINGPTTGEPGWLGGASYRFDGANNDDVTIPNDATLQPGSYTILIGFASAASQSASPPEIYAKESGGPWQKIAVRSGSIDLTTTASGTTNTLAPAASPLDEAFHVVGATYDADGSTFGASGQYMFFDGEQIGSDTTLSGAAEYTTQDAVIGNRTNGGSHGFSGRIGFVVIFNDALSATTQQQLYETVQRGTFTTSIKTS